MSKTIENFFKQVGGNDISSSKSSTRGSCPGSLEGNEARICENRKRKNFVQLAIHKNFVLQTFPRIRYLETDNMAAIFPQFLLHTFFLYMFVCSLNS